MSDYQAVVVGAGCAGSVAATVLARQGKSVLLIERGSFAGAKNMTGGRLYAHSLKAVFPNFEQVAPLERKITRENISLMTKDANTTISFTSPELGERDVTSYSVLRADFDNWLSSKAEEAGADCVYGITVEDLLWDDKRVVGIRCGEDEISADITLLADGSNSLLSERAGLAARAKPRHLAVGVKEVIALDETTIDDRFMNNAGEGTAWLFAGAATQGHVGGGFLYSNRESISLGLVVTLADLCASEIPIYQMLEDFKAHPSIAPLIKGGQLVEYSGHLIPEGGYRSIPTLHRDGCLLVGDAAMLCVNLGYQVRGMDYAIASGEIAATAAGAALDDNDCSAANLATYRSLLEESFVLRDLRAYQHFPEYLAQTKRLFKEYPELAARIMKSLFCVDGRPVEPLRDKVIGPVKGIGLFTVARDLRKGMKAL
ncbi:MAG: FAD-dependent oxidoreductase [Coriobacteriales bacterium]|jgi:electron transfer flavoprotein-quinone oxidoreductase|nr:FAD-dependent oxidoreductase [Coriobacteriales bacterium]